MQKILPVNVGKPFISFDSLEGNESKSSSDDPVQDDEFFLKKAFKDDPKEACSLLFKRYHSLLCNHTVRLVYSRQVAEDIVAEVFFQFWQKKTVPAYYYFLPGLFI